MNTCLELNYNNFIDKAKREIDRLRKAENELDPVAALDHALNAAFTVYHLLEWRQNPSSLSEKELKRLLKSEGMTFKTAHILCKEFNSPEMNLLHGIVTHTKHATVSSLLPDKNSAPTYKPSYEDNIGYIVTEDGERLVTESGTSIVTSQSTVTVYFGEGVALSILERAIAEFSPLP